MTVRSIYVDEPVGAPAPELTRSADVIHDTAVRLLLGRGYVAAIDPEHADAFLRAVWVVRPMAAGRPDGRVTLRMVLEARDGQVLAGVDVVSDAPVGFLSDARIAELVRSKLGPILP